MINIDRYGNTTAGTIPLAMDTARQEGKLKKGDLVLLASVGAGFTVGATPAALGLLDISCMPAGERTRRPALLI